MKILTDRRRQTDSGMTGILLAHPWAFASGDLKINFERRQQRHVKLPSMQQFLKNVLHIPSQEEQVVSLFLENQ